MRPQAAVAAVSLAEQEAVERSARVRRGVVGLHRPRCRPTTHILPSSQSSNTCESMRIPVLFVSHMREHATSREVARTGILCEAAFRWNIFRVCQKTLPLKDQSNYSKHRERAERHWRPARLGARAFPGSARADSISHEPGLLAEHDL
jgi:hypothetical protein